VLRLLGVKSIVVALTKSDLLKELGPEHRDLVIEELRELIPETPIIECSARTGEGIDALKFALSRTLENIAPRSTSGPLFLPLDRSFAVKGFGTVVTGTMVSGALAAGDEVDLLGGGAAKKDLRVRGVQVHGAPIEKAEAGQRTAVNLPGLEVGDAPRGAALVQAGSEAAQLLDVEVELLQGAPKALPARTRLLAHLGTAQIPCVLALLEPSTLEPGEKALGQLRLSKPAAAIAGLRFLLRGDPGKTRKHATTLGGGRVLSISPRKRKKREADLLALRDLAQEDPLKQAERIIFESGQIGATAERIAARGAFTRKSAAAALTKLAQTNRAVLYDRDAGLYAHAELIRALEKKILAQLGKLKEPTPREELRQKIGSPSPRLFAKAILLLQEKGELQADAESVRPPGVSAELHAPEEETLATLLDKAGLQPPRATDLPALLQQTPQRTQALLKSLAKANRAVKINDDFWFGAQPMMELRRKVLAHLHERGELDAQAFKELTGLSRKFAIPLLEYFDKERLTLRIGDKRVLRKGER
jgi:selenocysteine-specific elongation factor